jgi:short-subunit dehydrogenase
VFEIVKGDQPSSRGRVLALIVLIEQSSAMTLSSIKNSSPNFGKISAIIFNTSFVTEIGMPNFSIYSAAKSAVQSFIKTFAAEFVY